jgi:hypothetical protein
MALSNRHDGHGQQDSSPRVATAEQTDVTGHGPRAHGTPATRSCWCDVTPATGTRVRAAGTGLFLVAQSLPPAGPPEWMEELP